MEQDRTPRAVWCDMPNVECHGTHDGHHAHTVAGLSGQYQVAWDAYTWDVVQDDRPWQMEAQS